MALLSLRWMNIKVKLWPNYWNPFQVLLPKSVIESRIYSTHICLAPRNLLCLPTHIGTLVWIISTFRKWCKKFKMEGHLGSHNSQTLEKINHKYQKWKMSIFLFVKKYYHILYIPSNELYVTWYFYGWRKLKSSKETKSI